MRIEFATSSSIPFWRNAVFVTKRSSPTSCTVRPISSVRIFQPAQSFSAMPSSIETIGYWSHQAFQKATICSLESFRLSRSEEHTSELQSHLNLVCRLLLEKKKKTSRMLYN